MYGIIQRHGGMMDIESEKGRGTTFCIRLPVAPADAAAHEQPDGEPAAPKEVAGILRILVVDDLPIILDVLQAQLVEDGHEVETAGDGKEALEILDKGCFDLVITDQSMPGMTGEELAVVVKERCPKTAVILLTGFGGDSPETEGRGPRRGHGVGQARDERGTAPGHRAVHEVRLACAPRPARAEAVSFACVKVPQPRQGRKRLAHGVSRGKGSR